MARTTAAAVRIPIGGALGRSFFYFGGMATDVNRTKAYAEFNRRQICEGFMAECPLLLGPWAGHSDDHGLFMPRDAFRYDVDSDTWHTALGPAAAACAVARSEAAQDVSIIWSVRHHLRGCERTMVAGLA